MIRFSDGVNGGQGWENRRVKNGSQVLDLGEF